MIVLPISILLSQYNPMWPFIIYTEVYVYMQVDMNLPLHKQEKTLESEYSINKKSNKKPPMYS